MSQEGAGFWEKTWKQRWQWEGHRVWSKSYYVFKKIYIYIYIWATATSQLPQHCMQISSLLTSHFCWGCGILSSSLSAYFLVTHNLWKRMDGFIWFFTTDPTRSNGQIHCFAVLRKLVWKISKRADRWAMDSTLTDPALLALCHFFIRCDTGYGVEKSYYRACLLKGSTYCCFLQSSWNWIVQLYNTRKYMQILKITMVFGLLQYLQYYHQTAACESWQSMHPRRQCPWRIMTSSFSSNDLGEGWMAINNYCRLS